MTGDYGNYGECVEDFDYMKNSYCSVTQIETLWGKRTMVNF